MSFIYLDPANWRRGEGMGKIRQRVSLAIMTLALLFVVAPARAENCQLLKYTSFPIPENAQAVTVPTTVDGKRERFLVDTGGIFSILSGKVAAALDLHPESAGEHLISASGQVLDSFVHIDKFGIGPIVASDVNLMVEPKSGSADTDPIGGTIAPDILKTFDLDFDFGRHTLTLYSPKHCKGKVVYWSLTYGSIPFLDNGGHIVVPAELDGTRIYAIIDTGSSDSLLGEDMARRFFDFSKDNPNAIAIHGAPQDAIVRYRQHFKKLVIGPVTVTNPVLGVRSDKMEKSYDREAQNDVDPAATDLLYGVQMNLPPVIIGMDILRKLHLYVAYGERTLYVTGADAHLPGAAPVAKSASSN